MKTLRNLIDSWEGGDLSPDDLRQLKALLRDPEARAKYGTKLVFTGY